MKLDKSCELDWDFPKFIWIFFNCMKIIYIYTLIMDFIWIKKKVWKSKDLFEKVYSQ